MTPRHSTWDTSASMLEHRSDPLLPRHAFLFRVVRYLTLAMLVIGVALGIGVVGYHSLGGLPWIDALVNASMILGGMGPVDPITSPAGKVFASFYALFSGLLFIGAASIVLAPFFHRVMHKLHLDDDDNDASGPQAAGRVNAAPLRRDAAKPTAPSH